MTPQLSQNSRAYLLFGLLGTLFITALYLPLIISAEWTLLYRDISHYFLPLKHLWVTAMREQGSIPHWNPYHYGGTPYLSDCGPGPLYIFNWILLLFPTEKLTDALVFFIQIHHQLIFLGFLLVFRQWKVRPALAFVGALLLAVGGFAMSSDSLLHILGAQTAIPFLLLFWTRFRRKPNYLSLYFCSIFLAWPIYAGDPQFTYMAALLLLLDLWRSSIPWPTKCWSYFGLGFFTFLHAAPQLLPTLDFLRETSRGLGRTGTGDLLVWSMHPIRYLESIVPLAFGRSANLEEYWGHLFLNSGLRQHPYIFSLYLGFLPWLFVLWQIPQHGKKIRRGWRVAAPIPIFLFLVLCNWGAFSPLPIYEWLAQYFPFWSSFRHPERLAYWVVLAVGIDGILGAEKFFRLKKWTWAQPSLHWVSLLLLLVLALIGVFLKMHAAALLPLGLTAALILFTFLSLRKKLERKLQLAIVLLCLFDLLYFSSSLLWPFPKKFTQQETFPWAKEMAKDRQTQLPIGGAHRLFSTRDGQLDWKYAEPQWRSLDLSLFFDWALLTPNIPALFDQPDLGGFFTLAPVKVPDLQQRLAAKDFVKMLDVFSVRYFLALKGGSPSVYLNEDALPYVAPGLKQKFFSQDILLSQHLGNPAWEPQQEMLLPGDGPGTDPGKWKIERVTKSFDSLKISLSGDFSAPGWLLVNESFHRYWRVTEVSTQEVLPLRQANGWAMAVLVPARWPQNSVELEFSYENPWFDRGLGAFSLWILLGIFLVVARGGQVGRFTKLPFPDQAFFSKRKR